MALESYGYAEDVPRHLVMYTQPALRRLADALGFTIVSMETHNRIYRAVGAGVPALRYRLWATGVWRAAFQPAGRLSPVQRLVDTALKAVGRVLCPPAVEAWLGYGGVLVSVWRMAPTNPNE